MKRTYGAALLGLITLAGYGPPSMGARAIVQPMVTPTTGELGYEQGYPPQRQCRIYSVTCYGDCHAPLDGLRVQVSGGPQVGFFVTLPVSTTETEDHAVRVKAAVGTPAINDRMRQAVFSQLLVHGHPVISAHMQTVWSYRGGQRSCVGKTGWYGVATCSESALGFRTRDGKAIRITVSFTYGSRLYRSQVTYRAFDD